VRSRDDVALDLLELRLCLLEGELVASARLLKHVPARSDCREATRAA
jgi:hypothetical protein